VEVRQKLLKASEVQSKRASKIERNEKRAQKLVVEVSQKNANQKLVSETEKKALARLKNSAHSEESLKKLVTQEQSRKKKELQAVAVSTVTSVFSKPKKNNTAELPKADDEDEKDNEEELRQLPVVRRRISQQEDRLIRPTNFPPIVLPQREAPTVVSQTLVAHNGNSEVPTGDTNANTNGNSNNNNNNQQAVNQMQEAIQQAVNRAVNA